MFKLHNEHMKDGSSQRYTSLFVTNFGEEFDEKKLEELFGRYGTIYSCVVMKNEARRYGVVSYELHEGAVKAVKELDGKRIVDRNICVKSIMESEHKVNFVKHLLKNEGHQQKLPVATVRITKLEDGIDENELIEKFQRFGIIGARVS